MQICHRRHPLHSTRGCSAERPSPQVTASPSRLPLPSGRNVSSVSRPARTSGTATSKTPPAYRELGNMLHAPGRSTGPLVAFIVPAARTRARRLACVTPTIGAISIGSRRPPADPCSPTSRGPSTLSAYHQPGSRHHHDRMRLLSFPSLSRLSFGAPSGTSHLPFPMAVHPWGGHVLPSIGILHTIRTEHISVVAPRTTSRYFTTRSIIVDKL